MKSKTLQKLADVISTLSTFDNAKDSTSKIDNLTLAKFLGDVHWELEKSSKSSDGAKKNQKVIMEFFENYQNMAIDAEYVLMDYIETSWWHFSKRNSQMAKYIWLSNKRVALFQELLMKIKPSKIDEILDN